MQHSQATLAPHISSVVGRRVATIICCRQAGRCLAAQLVQDAQAALVAPGSSLPGEPFAVALPGAGLLPYPILLLCGESRRSRTVVGASKALRQHS